MRTRPTGSGSVNIIQIAVGVNGSQTWNKRSVLWKPCHAKNVTSANGSEKGSKDDDNRPGERSGDEVNKPADDAQQ